MDLGRKLQSLVGRIVTLSFADGEEIEARLAAVELEDHDDVIFDVLRVVRPGPASEYEPGSLYRSMIDTIIDVSGIERD